MAPTFPSLVILAVRHGHSGREGEPYGPETPLSPLGHRQANALADAMAGDQAISAIYSSPFPRALATATPLCDRLSLRPIVDDRLAEFDLAPALPGERQDLALWQAHHRGAPGGETLADFGSRVSDFIEDLCRRHEGESVVLFAHSGTIDAMARWGVGLEPGSPWQHELPLLNASITELRIWPRGRAESGSPRYVAFERVGDVAHLDPSLRTD